MAGCGEQPLVPGMTCFDLTRFDLACVFRDCLGVLDCQWCQVQKDGQTPLKSPYCDSQRACFGGVVGAHSPYGDEISGERQLRAVKL